MKCRLCRLNDCIVLGSSCVVMCELSDCVRPILLDCCTVMCELSDCVRPILLDRCTAIKLFKGHEMTVITRNRIWQIMEWTKGQLHGRIMSSSPPVRSSSCIHSTPAVSLWLPLWDDNSYHPQPQVSKRIPL